MAPNNEKEEEVEWGLLIPKGLTKEERDNIPKVGINLFVPNSDEYMIIKQEGGE